MQTAGRANLVEMVVAAFGAGVGANLTLVSLRETSEPTLATLAYATAAIISGYVAIKCAIRGSATARPRGIPNSPDLRTVWQQNELNRERVSGRYNPML